MITRKCPHCGAAISIFNLKEKCTHCNNHYEVKISVLKTSITFSVVFFLYRWLIWNAVDNLYLNIITLSLVAGFLTLFFSKIKNKD